MMATSQSKTCSILERHHSSLSQSMTSPYTVVRICQILYSKRCVDESVLGEVESANTSLEDKKRALMGAIEKAVSDDQRKLHELATVLDQFEETRAVVKNIISDYDANQKEVLPRYAKEAILKNTSRLINAVSGCSFQGFVTGCAEKSLITPYHRNHLIETSPVNKELLLIGEIEKVVHFQPSCLDTVLCILIDKCGIPGTVVAKAVANDYGYELPNYEKNKPTTEGMASEENALLNNEDRTSDILRTHYGTLSQSLKDPVNIARLLHGENVISEDAVTQVESTDIFNQTTVLLGSVRRAVNNNHQNLREFGRVLQQLAAGNETVGINLLKDYHKVFPVKSIFCSSQGETSTSDANERRHSMPLRMEEDFADVRFKFGIMCSNIEEILKDCVSVDKLKKICKHAYTDFSQQLDSYKSIEDVLLYITSQKCTLVNIRVLKIIIEHCKIKEAEQHIENYQQTIDEFREKMKKQFPLDHSLLPNGTPYPLQGKTITFTLEWVPTCVSFSDIDGLLRYTFENLYEYVQVLEMKKANSIIIICSFPYELTGLLIAKAMKKLELLKMNVNGFLKLTIGYCTIWDYKEMKILGHHNTLSENEILKQQIKAMIMENETLKSQLKSKEEREIEATREIEILQDKLLEKDKEREIEATREIEILQDKLLEKDKDIQLHKTTSNKVTSLVYSSLVKEIPPPDPNDTERKRRVKWDMSGSGSVTLTSPTPSDCIILIRQLSIDRRPCEGIRLNSSSTDSTIILLSLLHQTNVKRLDIYNTKITVEILQCLCHFININQLKYLCLVNTSLSTSGGLHLLTDAISTNTSLEVLELWNDRLAEDDMVNISQTLTINTTLQRLYLRNCNITDDGLVQLSNGLTHNKTLKELNISDNNLITLTTAVCDIIHNSSLTHLYLYHTSLPSDSIPQLLDALSTNNTIRQLWIDERHRKRCERHKNYQHIQVRLDFL